LKFLNCQAQFTRRFDFNPAKVMSYGGIAPGVILGMVYLFMEIVILPATASISPQLKDLKDLMLF